MKWKLLAVLCLLGFTCSAQVTLRKCQYWFDDNFAAADSMAVPATEKADFSKSFPTTAVSSAGLHVLHTRFQQSDGRWSSTFSQFFYKALPLGGSSRQVNLYEYWFDNDYAGRVSQPVNNTSAPFTASINVPALTTGLHVFHIRFRDNGGMWSTPFSQQVLKTGNASGGGSRTIASYEYWFDGNFNSRVSQQVTSTAQLSLIAPINASALPVGTHIVHMRFKDNGNNWSGVSSSLFIRIPAAVAANAITSFEYWYDNNFGSRISQVLTSASQLQYAGTLQTASLSNGVHTLRVRFKDKAGSWSSVFSTVMLRQGGSNSVDSNVITAMRYWFDNARNNITTAYLPAPSKKATIMYPVFTGNLDTGKHYIRFQFRDTLHQWSSVYLDSFRFTGIIPQDIVVNLTNSAVCAGTTLAVPFTLNRNFNVSNVFTAQLSDAAGSFTNPVTIGVLPGNAAGSISTTIPSVIAAGNAYRVRIVASSPADTSGGDTTRITVRRVPEQSFSINGPLLQCTGNAHYSIYGKQPGATYTWQAVSGGTVNANDTMAAVLWQTAGTHALIATAANTCGNGFKDTVLVKVLNSIPAGSPVIQRAGDALVASALTGDAGGYQWYRNDTLIAGATDSSYLPVATAVYKVSYTNLCGTGISSAGMYYFVKIPQSISFSLTPAKTYGDAPFALTATTTSGLPIAYQVSGPGQLLGGDSLLITGAGTITVTARQAGDSSYNAAMPVARTVIVARAAQVVTLVPIMDRTYSTAPVTLNATASTGLPVSFSVLSGYASLNGNILSLGGAGAVIVRAAQTGNQNYLPAFVNDTFCVIPALPDTIRGYAVSCIATQRYYVDSVKGVAYTWSLSGGGSLSNTSGGAVNVSWTALGNYMLRVTATTGCGDTQLVRSLAVQVATPSLPGSPANLYPGDSITVSSFPLALSWQPAVNTQRYDVYVWQAGTTMPATPLVAGLSGIGTAIYSSQLAGFSPGAWYNWKVVARNACAQTASVIRSFKVAELPDLAVFSISAPDTVFSNTNINVAVTVKNTGRAATSGTWLDNLSISPDSLTNFIAPTPLRNSTNLSALDTQQSYTRMFTVTLPPQLVGVNFLHATTGPLPAEMSGINNHRYRSIYIRQSPVPDLRVQSVLTTGNTFSGNDMTVTWTVKNHGQGSTGTTPWADHIYLSQEPVFNTGTSILVSTQTHNAGILYPDSAYTTVKTISLPAQLFGMYYVYVIADGGNTVYESAFEQNNTGRSDSVMIYLTPSPDFQVAGFHVPDNVSRGETLSVDWTIRNAGAIRRAKDSVWTDAVLITSDSAGLHEIASYRIAPPRVQSQGCLPAPCPLTAPAMDAEGTYYQTAMITMPSNYDTVYVRLKTDYTNAIFEYQHEDNNSSNVIRRTFLKPDLAIESFYVPVPMILSFASNKYSVMWTVRNNGPGKVPGVPRTDAIYLSVTPSLNTATALRLHTVTYSNAIDTGGVVLNRAQVTIPDSIPSGSYYMFVVTDLNQNIAETNENNNREGLPFTLKMPKPADLRVTQVAIAPAAINTMQKVYLSYSVINQDSGAVLGKSWVDKVYLSALPAWNKDSVVLVATYTRNSSLYLNDTYTNSDSIQVTNQHFQQLKTDSSNCYFFVWTDGDDQVYESNHENNNITRSNSIQVRKAAGPDLAEIALTVPDSLWSGKTGNVSWTVRNTGSSTRYFSTSWEDKIYLSADTIPDAADLLVRSVPIARTLDSNDQYGEQAVFTVPNGLSGYYYVLVVADAGNRNAENNRANNYKILHRPDGSPVATYISLTPPPDLVVNMISLPPVSYSGQPSLVKWQVKNAGPGITTGNSWPDQAYLSADTILDNSDVVLGSYLHTGNLANGASYTDSALVFMPVNAAGNYYLLFKTDASNAVYEHLNEHNNVAAALCFIIRPEPADLVVRDVTVDPTCIAGDSATIRWVVQNNGVNAARGYMSQGIYLSADATVSNDDVIVTDPATTINLVPGDTAHFSARFRVKDVAAGYYYTIVRTDLRNNIVETDDGNNDGVASPQLQVLIPQLPLDIVTYNVLQPNYELYYRIDIPPAIAGQTISVSLKGDSLSGMNELYLRYDSVATRNRFDYKYDQAGGNQVIVIPEAKAGTYYLLAYGNKTSGTPQHISLLAKRINFSILSFQAREGGNTGNVTVRISGAKFGQGMTARLFSSSLGTVTAGKVLYVSSTLAYATFNLAGRPVGSYSLKLVKPALDSVTAGDLFTVVTGKGGTTAGGGGTGGNGFYCAIKNTGVDELLGFDVQRPASIAPQRVFPMTIIFGNAGDVDIPVPTRMLISENGYPVAFTTTTLSEAKQELFLEFKEVNGPSNLLRPGAVGYFTVFTRSAGGGTVMNFSLIE